MKRLLLFVLLGCTCGALARSRGSAVPELLIVQLHVPLIDSASPATPPIDPNVAVADVLAQSLDDDGRVAPIVWSITDPTFRDALTKGKLNDVSPDPSLDGALKVASRLGWEYVLFVKVVRNGKEVTGQSRLYRGRSEIWRDPAPIDRDQLAMLKQMLRQKRMTQDAFDRAVEQQEYLHLSVVAASNDERVIMQAEENTAKSIARTWGEALAAGPLKSLTPKRRQATPPPSPGQDPHPAGPPVHVPTSGPVGPPLAPPTGPGPTVKPPADLPVGNDALKASLKSLLDNHQTAAAIGLLRDAIDASPLDAERRGMLVEVLLGAGYAEQAAQTARQAASILPDKVGLRVLAARAWLEAGKPDEAQIDLNEAIARDPDSPDTRLLLGQIALRKGDLPNAFDHLGAGLAKHPTADLFYERAVANAIGGNSLGASADMAKAVELGLPSEGALARYREAVHQFDAAFERGTEELRSIVQRAALKRKDPGVRVLLERNASMATTRAAFLEKLNPPAQHQKSHDQRVLALKLLVQCLGDVRSYIETGDDEALSDARLNLGEALGGLASAKALFASESAPPSAHDRP